MEELNKLQELENTIKMFINNFGGKLKFIETSIECFDGKVTPSNESCFVGYVMNDQDILIGNETEFKSINEHITIKVFKAQLDDSIDYNDYKIYSFTFDKSGVSEYISIKDIVYEDDRVILKRPSERRYIIRRCGQYVKPM